VDGKPGAWLVAAAAAGVAATGLLGPWWQAARPTVVLSEYPDGEFPGRAVRTEFLRGAELLGSVGVGVLVGLAVVTVLCALAGLRSRGARSAAAVLAVATGAVALTEVGFVLVSRGGGGGAGGWAGLAVSAAAGALAVAAGAASVTAPSTGAGGWPAGPGAAPAPGVGRPGRWGTALALVMAVGTTAVLVVTSPPGAAPVTDPVGPFRQVSALDATELRSGLPGLASGLNDQLVAVGTGSAVAGLGGLARVDGAGRTEVLARFPEPDPGYRPRGVLAATADRVAWTPSYGTVAVRGIGPDDPTAALVTGVGETSRSDRDGRLLLRADTDPARTFRVLDLGSPLAGAVPATTLPALSFPAAGPPDQPGDLRLLGEAALRTSRVGAGYRLQRLQPDPAAPAPVVLAGGLDPSCGLTRSGPMSFLPRLVGPTVDPAGDVWLVVSEGGDGPNRLVRLSGDGELRVVAQPVPGQVDDLVATADGGIDLLVSGPDRRTLWRLPAAATALSELPPPPAGCLADPAPLGPPAQLAPVADPAAGDPLGVPLSADGRWASAAAGRGTTPNEISVVAPDGSRTALGPRLDGNLGLVWPDGTGGVWWLEMPDGSASVTLVHGQPGAQQRRYVSVPHPAPREGSTLLPDLGGRPPLLGTAVGAFRIDNGQAELVIPGPIAGGAVRADGRGWVLADGRLVALDRGRVLGPVIDAGPGRGADVPVVVQLARGVAPTALALPRAQLALDQQGRAIVVSDGTALAVDRAGRVRPVAQDDRLDDVETLTGGMAVHEDGAWLLVRLAG
jgi:hypothetical protein